MWQRAILVVCLLLFAPRARAEHDPPPETAAQVSRARQLFEEQKYGEAAMALQAAYRLTPNPLYLFNAGQSYRKAEDKAHAIELYREFLRSAPDHKLANEARAYVKELETALQLQAHLSTIKLELEAERAESDDARRKAIEAQLALEKERKKPFYKRGWFYGVMIGSTLGVAAIIAAGVGIAVGSDPRRSADARDLPIQF